jgi:aldose 1-epimerase
MRMDGARLPHDVIELAADGFACAIAPGFGGAILRLTHRGMDLLRPAADEEGEILATASFALVPFCNRIRNGRFHFEGTDVALPADPVSPPHALHGEGWRRPWLLQGRDADRAVLVLEGGGGSWPWRYHAIQTLRLGPDGLAVDIAVRNLEPDRAMPIGVGVHPYFRRYPDSRINARATGLWLNDDDALARERVADTRFGVAAGVDVSALEGLDNFFEGSGEMVITGGPTPLRVTGAPAAGFHVYAPAGRDHFCLEPVSHPPDSFGRGEITPADVLAPGEERIWRFTIGPSPGAPQVTDG